MTFRKGDIVRCVNAVGCHTVHEGLTYKVTGVERECVYLSGREDRNYKASRFVLERNDDTHYIPGLDFSKLEERVLAVCRRPLSRAVTNQITILQSPRIPNSHSGWCCFLASGGKLKFRSGCAVTFVAYVPDAKPHCQLVLLNPSTGNVVTRYANGNSSDEAHDEPGDILVATP